MSYSPDEMALDRLISYYETRICVLMGVDPMVAGVGSGTAQKTYANLGEALNDFWVRTVVPMHNRHAAVLTAQLLPLFGLEPKEWRLRFDYSQVAALRENKDGLHARIREDFKAGVIDLWTAQSERGLQPEDGYRGRFYEDSSAGARNAVKALAQWDESKHPRDDIGRWTSVGGGHLTSQIGTSEGANPFRIYGIRPGGLTDLDVEALMPSSPHPFVVAGVPVRDGLRQRPSAKELAPALEVIASLHGDGNLPQILLSVWDRPLGMSHADGVFLFYSGFGVADCIRVSSRAQSPLLTVIHEIGHFIDYKGLRMKTHSVDFATDELRLLEPTHTQKREWRTFHAAVTQSKAWQTLLKFSQHSSISDSDPLTGRVYTYDINQRDVEYLMDPSEVFARAYEQYVAVRCDSATFPALSLHLRRHIASQAHHCGVTHLGGTSPDSLHYPFSWESKDFEPISEALDQIFVRHGWLSKT